VKEPIKTIYLGESSIYYTTKKQSITFIKSFVMNEKIKNANNLGVEKRLKSSVV
jgi:hypothetical protein